MEIARRASDHRYYCRVRSTGLTTEYPRSIADITNPRGGFIRVDTGNGVYLDMADKEAWYSEEEILKWLEWEKPSLCHECQWIAEHFNSAFQKGRQIGRGEFQREIGGQVATLVMPDRLREWREKHGESLVPMATRFTCSLSEASALERGVAVRSDLVAMAEAFLANNV